jgi:hypothetical protein
MTTIFELIQDNPGYFALILALTNAGWIVFAYFNSQAHQRALADQQHELDLDLERRKHIFELRLSQYENFLKKLDSFGKNYQSDLLSKMEPFTSEFLQVMLSSNTDQERNAAIGQFSTNVMSMMNDASSEYHVLRSESQTLKLTASDTLVALMEELEVLLKDSMEYSSQFISDLPQLIIDGDSDTMGNKQRDLAEQGRLIQEKSALMQSQMRKELHEI